MPEAAKNQSEIPGTQTDKIPAIEAAAGAYVNARDERMKLTEDELARRQELETVMQQHELETYRYQDGERRYEVLLKTSEIKAKVRTLKDDE